MNYDPLVHNYVKGKMIGGCLGLVLGVFLIVLGSCLSACNVHWVTPQPHPTHIAPRVAPPTVDLVPTVTPTPGASYKCER